jgi:hypothetical protein
MTIYKAPFEQFGIALDFSADIGAGNSIASIAAVTATSELSKLDSTSEVIDASSPPGISGTAVNFKVRGGVPGETHTISVQIVSSIGEKYQGDVTLRIVE